MFMVRYFRIKIGKKVESLVMDKTCELIKTSVPGPVQMDMNRDGTLRKSSKGVLRK